MSGTPFTGLHNAQPLPRPLPSGAPSAFASRLAMVGRSMEPERDGSARAAYAALVSAACYLATRRDGDPAAIGEAIRILRRYADAMPASGLDLGDVPREAENRTWVSAHHRWERQKSVEGAIHYVKAASAAREWEKARKRRSWLARRLDAWRGAPSMQSF